jgi:Protein of unknown function (DUF1559)
MHAYHDKHGRLPPAVVYGADDKPLYSWRVLLLPYIEQRELYEQFHLDEPWDSEHNIRLLPRMPATYAPPPGKARRAPPHHTFFHVFVGPGTAFEGREGLRLSADFPDSTADTLLVVEAGEPVPWTKPQDLDYEPGRPLPCLDGPFRDGFRACAADGSRRWVRKGTSDETLRPLITRNGGDKPGPE